MFQVAASMLATSAPSSKPVTAHSCTVAYEGNSIGVTTYQLAAAKSACAPKWIAATPVTSTDGTACRAVFNLASNPKFFDGAEHSAHAYANGGIHSGRVTEAACHFATAGGIEVYTHVFEVLGSDCELEWHLPADMKKDPLRIDDTSTFLCAAQYPSAEWHIGWMDAKVMRPILSTSVDRRQLQASPSPGPSRKKVFMNMVINIDDVSEAETKRGAITQSIATMLSISTADIALQFLAGSVTVKATITVDDTEVESTKNALTRRMSTVAATNQVFASAGVTVSEVPTVYEEGGEGLSGGAIAGIVIGCLVGVGGLIAVLVVAMSGKGDAPDVIMSKEMHKSNDAL